MMQPGDQLLLFTYGTLKRGEKNHPAIMSDMYLRETFTSRNYMLVDLGPYPGMIENLKDGFSVRGELFKIPIYMLEDLDKIEGSPNLFKLEPITLADGSKAFAYLYKQNIDETKILYKGIWPS